MDIMTSLQILLEDCNNLKLNEYKILEKKYVINKKIESILNVNGCKIIKNKNFIMIKKEGKLYALINPDVEISALIDSNISIKSKLEKIYKIVKNYEILESTANKLNKFLEKIDEIKEFKDLIINIKKSIRIKKIRYA